MKDRGSGLAGARGSSSQLIQLATVRPGSFHPHSVFFLHTSGPVPITLQDFHCAAPAPGRFERKRDCGSKALTEWQVPLVGNSVKDVRIVPRSNSVEIFLKGGLGNQLFQYAAARGLASHVGANSVTLNLSYLRSWLQKAQRVTVRKFELAPLLSLTNVDVKTPSTAGAVIQRLATYNRQQKTRGRYTEKGWGYESSFWDCEPPIMLEGYFHTERYFTNVAQELQEEFHLIHSLFPKLASILATIKAQNSVGVHVRRGDYLSANPHTLLPASFFDEAIVMLNELIPGGTFYFFSDDPDWVHAQNFSKAGQVVSDGSFTGFEELVLLAACSHFIISNSTFSWWGAWLGVHREKVVISPRDWFTDGIETPQDLLPESWIRIPNVGRSPS